MISNATVANMSVHNPVKKKNQFVETMKRLGDNKGAVFGGIIFLLVLLVAIFAPLLAPYSTTQINVLERLQGPSAKHWFGTDQMGRDIFSRAIFGARYSLLIGIGSCAFSAFFGVIVGSIAGYFGGWYPNGRTLYCSISGMNMIVTCRLDEKGMPVPTQWLSCRGNFPRGMTLSPDGRFLLCGNMVSGDITVFAADEEGLLTDTGRTVPAVSPSAIRFFRAE